VPNFVKIGQSVAPSWIFEIVNFYLLTVSRGPRRITISNFVKIDHSIVEILHFFEFSKWPLSPSWIFLNKEILLAIGAERVKTHQHAKFCPNRSIGCEDIKIFRFLKIAAAAILDCRIHKISLADSGQMAQTHHFTKFHENWSFHCGDVAIFRIFKTTAAILDFGNREFLFAVGIWRAQTHHCTKIHQN